MAVVDTDAGQGYLKALGGQEGPHTLAAEWVATQLARWLGLPTFDFAIVDVDSHDEIPFVDRLGEVFGRAAPGPAFITRRVDGEAWSGARKQLEKLSNPLDVGRLVVFDTWVLNCDRHGLRRDDLSAAPRINFNNVFLSADAPDGRLRLIAMDHTHCFSCGGTLKRSLARIDIIRDARLFGMFPAFREFIGADRRGVRSAVERLMAIDASAVWPMVETIPREWEVARDIQASLVELVIQRGKFVATSIENKIWPQTVFDFSGTEDSEPSP